MCFWQDNTSFDKNVFYKILSIYQSSVIFGFLAGINTPQVLINLYRVSGVRDEKKWSDGVKLQPIETKSQEKRKEAI